MTLIKSILLGSAAGVVAVAGAQAADLPTKKAAPVAQYVKICNVGGITGWTLPGSDTCVKFSGYITGQFEGGNLSNQYNWGSISQLYTTAPLTVSVNGNTVNTTTSTTTPINGIPAGAPTTLSGNTVVSQRVLIAPTNGIPGTQTWSRDATGWTTRANFGFDFASNTAYGPLIGHFDINANMGNGFDNTGQSLNVNTAYLTWAGITAGVAPSFFSFVGGGDNWANFFSPDRKGFNEPNLFAYTASFGGGFSATLSAESRYIACGNAGGGTHNGSDCGTGGNANDPTNITYGGQRWPDIVGQLHVTQGWGEAQLSGVLHDVNVQAQNYNGSTTALTCGVSALGTSSSTCNYQETKVGWAIDAGVKFNLPSFGPGDNVLITGEYGQSASNYSGLTQDAMWGEWGQVNGNGQPMYLADAFYNGLTNQWSVPTTWSVTAQLEHHFTPQFYVDLLGSVGGFKWSNMGGGCNLLGFGCGVAQAIQGPLSPNGTSWLIGTDIGWNPVTNLNFDLELMYQATTQAKPSGYLGTVYNYGTPNAYFVPGAWEGNSSGFAGRIRVTRYF